MAYSIMLDAGHGGQDPGAVYKGRQEKNDNLKLALAVGEILKNKGIDISYTRTGDVYQTQYLLYQAEIPEEEYLLFSVSFSSHTPFLFFFIQKPVQCGMDIQGCKHFLHLTLV